MLFGGLAIDVCSDLRIYDAGENKWEKPQLKALKKGFEVAPRYGHSLHAFSNQLIVYGGASQYILKLKCRQTLSDIRILDLGK